MWDFPLFPERASTAAIAVDNILFVLIGLSAVFILLIFAMGTYFVLKYRGGAGPDQYEPMESSVRLELVWIAVPLVLSVGMFLWAARLYYTMHRVPEDAVEVYVVAKQWMWKFQHAEGQREIDELHVPVGRPIRLVMASQDVIHSFFVPAFRVKQDVVPGRYVETWFEATKPGEYHLFCAEYCGTSHAKMTGRIVVMEPARYEQWLNGTLAPSPQTGPSPPSAQGAPGSLAQQGGDLFRSLGCSGCHLADGSGPGPSLVGIFGQPVPLASGETITVDEQYIRDSILMPSKQVVAGYSPIMPSFQGQVSEEQLMQLVAYVKSLGTTSAEDNEGAPTGTVPAVTPIPTQPGSATGTPESSPQSVLPTATAAAQPTAADQSYQEQTDHMMVYVRGGLEKGKADSESEQMESGQ